MFSRNFEKQISLEKFLEYHIVVGFVQMSYWKPNSCAGAKSKKGNSQSAELTVHWQMHMLDFLEYKVVWMSGFSVLWPALIVFANLIPFSFSRCPFLPFSLSSSLPLFLCLFFKAA